jgi:hypothetical protein
MLGVPGNIGFSTSLHGVIAAKANGPDQTVCVGDDAIALSFLAPEDSIIPHITSLGVIAIEKFSVIQPVQEDFFKFLKRRLTRTQDYLWLSYLFSIPIFVTIDGIVPPLRTAPIRFEMYDRIFATVSHIGKLLWDLFENAYLVEDEEDINLISLFCRQAYEMMGLPRNGALPGYRLRLAGINVVAKFAIPPIRFPQDYDPRAEDWCIYLYHNSPDRIMMLPVTVPYQISLDPDRGSRGFCTKNRFLRVLEDLEVVQIKKEYEYVEVMDEDNLRRFRMWLKRIPTIDSFPLVSYVVIGDIPRWYVDMFAVPSPEWIRHGLVHTLE